MRGKEMSQNVIQISSKERYFQRKWKWQEKRKTNCNGRLVTAYSVLHFDGTRAFRNGQRNFNGVGQKFYDFAAAVNLDGLY